MVFNGHIQVEAWRAAKHVEEQERVEREELLRANEEAKLEEVGRQLCVVRLLSIRHVRNYFGIVGRMIGLLGRVLRALACCGGPW